MPVSLCRAEYGTMLEDEYDSTRSRRIDRALLLAALVSFCFGCTAMLAGLIR